LSCLPWWGDMRGWTKRGVRLVDRVIENSKKTSTLEEPGKGDHRKISERSAGPKVSGIGIAEKKNKVFLPAHSGGQGPFFTPTPGPAHPLRFSKNWPRRRFAAGGLGRKLRPARRPWVTHAGWFLPMGQRFQKGKLAEWAGGFLFRRGPGWGACGSVGTRSKAFPGVEGCPAGGLRFARAKAKLGGSGGRGGRWAGAPGRNFPPPPRLLGSPARNILTARPECLAQRSPSPHDLQGGGLAHVCLARPALGRRQLWVAKKGIAAGRPRKLGSCAAWVLQDRAFFRVVRTGNR